MTFVSIGARRPDLPSNNNYWVADTANVIGSVELKDQTSVWFGATIRGDNEIISIDSGTNIQENCVLHTDLGYPLTIGKNCTIGHGAILHGCVIGNNCIIGMGAKILNGAAIGDNCIVGAGSLITEKKDFLAGGTLILGAPAKVVRNLNKHEIINIIESASGYISKARKFREDIKVLNV